MRLSVVISIGVASWLGACGGGEGEPGPGPQSPVPISAWLGTYTAQWNGTTTFSSPAGLPAASNRENAVITVTAGEATGQIVMRWQLTGNPQSGTVVFTVSGDGASMVPSPLNAAFTGTTSNGTVAMSSCDVCTASLDGDTLIQSQQGHNAGVTNGLSWTGTYTGAWQGIRQR